jgi:hypothetical protein
MIFSMEAARIIPGCEFCIFLSLVIGLVSLIEGGFFQSMKSNQPANFVKNISSYIAMFIISFEAGSIRIQLKIIFLNVISKEFWTGTFYGVLPGFCCYFSK